MSVNNIKKRLEESSKQDKSWIERAKYRIDNKSWLDISFSIAVHVLSALKANKEADVFPKTQKELAEALSCSPQYVSKLLKGTENLQLETITKIEQILNVKLIQVPEFETSLTMKLEPSGILAEPDEQINAGASYSSYDELYSSYSYNLESDCEYKLVA